MDEHEVDGGAGGRVAEGDFAQFGDQEGVAGDVDAEACWKGGGVRGVLRGGFGGRGEGVEEVGGGGGSDVARG